MDNEAFKAHLKSTGPYLNVAQESIIHSIVVDEHSRQSVIHMSYFLRPVKSEEAIEQDLVWMLKFTDDQDDNKVLIKEAVEFVVSENRLIPFPVGIVQLI